MFKSLNLLIITILKQIVVPHKNISIVGLFLFLFIMIQVLSGIMLSFSLVNESLLIAFSRECEDLYDLYTDDFFWLHERGVDYIFLLLYIHLMRKLFLNSFSVDQESAWKSGSFMFLILHGIIFFGLVLCCTHLSDITLKIAANIAQTITLKYGNFGYWLFTDNTLNTDTIIRLMYLHYILPFFLVYISIIHLLDMHYGYKDGIIFNGLETNFFWFGLVLKNELSSFLNMLIVIIFPSYCLFEVNEALSYEIFMWGDVGLVRDVRFLGVSQHWYFKSYMGWLIFCPHHFFGFFGLVFFIVVIFLQPNLKRPLFLKKSSINKYYMNFNFSIIYNTIYYIFVLSIFYACSFLPYGRFFIRVNGNFMTLFSYFFIFVYLVYNLYFFFLNIKIRSYYLSC